MFINEIFELDELLEYEKQVNITQNTNITNISFWNASPAYQDYMLQHINIDYTKDIFNYKYTYDFSKETRNHIIKKLTGKATSDAMCLLTPSSTVSIINMINYLKQNNYQKLCILTPAYFSVEENCKIFNLPYEKKELLMENGRYIIPKEYIIRHHFDAIWLTSPVYSTGISYDKSQITILEKLMKKNILIIADETLALPGQELVRVMPISDYFFSICSPHKSLFINSIKFSAIICPKKNDDFLEQWIDVLGGGLLHSNISAIFHFLTPNYEECVQKSILWFSENLKSINCVLHKLPIASCNTSENGAYKTIDFKYFARDPYNLDNIKDLISRHHISYIPGKFNGFDSTIQKCFRINLSLTASEIESTLYQILKYYA